MKYIIEKVSLAMMALAFTSCLKDHVALDPGQSNNVVEFENTGSVVSPVDAVVPRFSVDLGSLGEGDSAKINLNLSYSGADMAPSDITVTLEVDTDALNAYNADQGTDYVAPPASVFRLPSSAVIKSGTQKIQVQATIIRSSDFDFDANYALPLKIASVSTGIISGNFGKALYSFAVRNSYDGVYTVTGDMVDYTNGTLWGYYPVEAKLITYTGNSVAYYDDTYAHTYGHRIKSGPAGGPFTDSYYGNFSPVFYFDAAGNITSVTNYYGKDAGATKRNAELDPTGVNKLTWDADGKVAYFEVSYFMTENGAVRCSFKEKLTYKSPR
ncbi:MAG TPA: DUF1735 domain-containing protein [Chitinophaga sp.]|uniref:DUF1735 domain-containing protein n=1 Tax=Chitinophaga sp. TaxID=1869181 RepID=UPI002DBBACF2|nr:DUF1735 domain-containing protein [Chitinophaga sp.]HEU4555818.1 DUF1735 domain-containing protein [Chitinophaga sp.]